MYEIQLEKDLFLYCNGELFRKIYYPFFKRKLTLPKSFVTTEELEEWFFSLEYGVAKSYLSFLLARRDYFKNELEKKLKLKHISLKSSTALLEEFENLGFINDERVIASYIRKYKIRKSPREIELLLRRKGIEARNFSKDLFALSEEEELDMIRKLAFKKREKDPRKIFAYLYRKGFQAHLIKKILEEIS